MSAKADTIRKLYDDAIAHLQDLQREELAGKRACTSCKWGHRAGEYSWDRVCRHPLIKRGEHDRILGKTEWRYPEWKSVRSRGGACGSDGILFERPPLHVRAFRSIPGWAWPIIVPCALVSAFIALLLVIR